MDTRKVTLIATIAAILLLAVGIGYAYTASTLNSGNEANSEYVTLVQGDATDSKGAYNFASGVKVTWDTVDERNGSETGDSFAKTTFSFNTTDQTVVTDVITGYTLVQVGKAFDVLTLYSGANPAAALSLSIEQTGFTNDEVVTAGTADVFFFLKVDVTGNAGTTGHEKEFFFKLDKVGDNYVFKSCSDSGVITSSASKFVVDKGTTTTSKTDYKTATISVYYGYATESGIVKTHAKDAQPAGPDAVILDDATLTFKYNSTV